MSDNNTKKEHKIIGQFTQMVHDRQKRTQDNSFANFVTKNQNTDKNENKNLESTTQQPNQKEFEKLTPKQQGFKVTLKLLNQKLEELLAKKNQSDGDEESTSDFAAQVEMLENLLEKQKENEIAELERIQQEEQELTQEEQQKLEQQALIEFLLTEEEMKKLYEFCINNDIEITISKDDKKILGEHTKAALTKNRGIGISREAA